MFSDLVVEDCDITSPELVAKQEIAKVALGRQDSGQKKKRPSERQEMVYDDEVKEKEVDQLEQIEEREANDERSSMSKNMSFDRKEVKDNSVDMDFSMT